jgi:hypothetical protein
MDKLDKKALKILKTKQYDDLDTGDIAIALQCDDDSVEESLNSLKDKKLIESYFRRGKVYWRLFADEPFKKTIDSENFELNVEPAEKSISEPEEFIIDRIQDEPAKVIAKPIAPELTFEIEPIEKNVTETAAFIINEASEEPINTADEEALVDDQTRVWTLPLTKPIDHEATLDNEMPEPEIADDADNTIPLKRANFSIIGIFIAIVVSVSISSGITMFVSMNVNNTVNSDLQTLRTIVTETNVKHDRQIEILAKKLNLLIEKTDLLQKLKPTPRGNNSSGDLRKGW